uniref:Protein arginine N-methyltransferase n=1 Tax=Rhipicephalus pulchellus TaxID=72859 RepID=L7M4L7_RHIPC
MAQKGTVENPLTGANEVSCVFEDFDCQQEIARSAFADMLHDDERNGKYHFALCEAIDRVHEAGNIAVVLDIGTGSGLLAMIAAKHGAEAVYACEAFKPVAQCAEQVMKDNHLKDRIHLIPKRSTEVEVGLDKDMAERANVVVAEVFDTELIGEGALETFRDALIRLATWDCITVPHAATMYAQVVESPFLRSFHIPNDIQVTPELTVEVPALVRTCPGSPAVFDIQLSQLQQSDFVCVTDQMPVFRFVFSEIDTLKEEETACVYLMSKAEATCHAVVMWWELEMDRQDSIHLSCAPYWAHPSGKKQPWRDHWIQAVYFPPYEVKVSIDQEFSLVVLREGYNICVLVSMSETPKTPAVPACRCGLHNNASRCRIGALSDRSRHVKFADALQKVINEESVCLCVGSDIMLPLMASKLGAQVYVVIEDDFAYPLLEEYTKQNEMKPITGIKKDALYLSEKEPKKKASVVLGEPHFSTSILPWHNLKFWFRTHSLQHLMYAQSERVTIPQGFCLKAVGVQFQDLWKIKAPVHNVEGFDLSSFDSLIQTALSITDDSVEPQPLWEYPCKALTEEFVIAQLDMRNDPETAGKISRAGEEPFRSKKGACNGVALWADFKLDDSNTVTSGPTQKIVPGEKIVWDRFSRQGVYFFDSTKLDRSKVDPKVLKWSFKFDVPGGSMNFSFDVQ